MLTFLGKRFCKQRRRGRRTLCRYISLPEAFGEAVSAFGHVSSLHHSCSPPSRVLIKLGSATRRILPVQPKRPRWVQGQRRRLFLSVFLCDVFQLFLVDVNVVFGGHCLAAQAASVRLHVRVTRRNRHLSRLTADGFNISPPVWSSEIKTPG